MANKQALRDLQSRLAERLQAARTEPLAQSWLAVECSSRGFLFPLREAGEIFSLTPMVAVPHSHRWFLGVANLRGHLHGVVDLAGFLGVKSADSPRDQARLVGFNQSLDLNCVLLVHRLSGLRSEEELTRDGDDNEARPTFAGAAVRDAASRLQGADPGAAPLGAALPLLGERPAAEQQRILLAMLGGGLVGLIVLTILSFSSAGRGSAQVAASGQALMQSQRLAKSVSQALTGNPAAFPEVKQSAEVLGSNVRSLKTGDGNVAAAPSGVQDALDTAMPLVERAEKSAGVVVAQEKALTEVGQSLRAINRQSVDLL